MICCPSGAKPRSSGLKFCITISFSQTSSQKDLHSGACGPATNRDGLPPAVPIEVLLRSGHFAPYGPLLFSSAAPLSGCRMRTVLPCHFECGLALGHFAPYGPLLFFSAAPASRLPIANGLPMSREDSCLSLLNRVCSAIFFAALRGGVDLNLLANS